MYPTLTSVLHNEILEEMDSTQILKLQQQNELENQPVQLVQKTHILSKHRTFWLFILLLCIISAICIGTFVIYSSKNKSATSMGTMFAADKERTGLFTGKDIDHMPTILWTFTTDHKHDPINAEDAAISSSPVVAEGKVFFATIGGDIYAVNSTTGKKIWQTTMECTINDSSPSYANGIIYIGSDCDGLSAIDAKNGKKTWNFNPIKKENNNSIYTDNSFKVTSSPVIIDNKVYAGTQDGIYILDVISGKESLHITKAGGNSVALKNNMIFSNDELGQLYSNNITNGSLNWTKKIENTTLFSYPVISKNTVILGNDNGQLFAFDIYTGQNKWTYNACSSTPCGIGIRESPAVDGSFVYAISSEGNISAVDLSSGKEKWQIKIGNHSTYSPIINNNTIYLTTLNHEVSPNDNYLYAIDAITGKKNWQFFIPPLSRGVGNSILNSASVYNGVIYFGTDGGILYALH